MAAKSAANAESEVQVCRGRESHRSMCGQQLDLSYLLEKHTPAGVCFFFEKIRMRPWDWVIQVTLLFSWGGVESPPEAEAPQSGTAERVHLLLLLLGFWGAFLFRRRGRLGGFGTKHVNQQREHTGVNFAIFVTD